MSGRALSTWSLHEPIFAGQMTPTEALAEAAGLGFEAVEFNDLFAAAPRPPLWLRVARRGYRLAERLLPVAPPKPSAHRIPRRYDPAIAPTLAEAAERAGVRLVSWALDTDLTAADDPRQQRYWEQGIATARGVGAELLRITSGGPNATPQNVGALRASHLPRAVAALARLTEMAEAAGLRLAVENHWGLSAEPALLTDLVVGVGAPRERLGVCLDFGNFPPGREHEGIRHLAPLTTHLHVKSYAFGPDGEETRLPYGPIFETLRAGGASGWLVIEFEGSGDPATGIRATRRLLDRHAT